MGESALGTKVELKNLNSISFVRDGIAHEIRRQTAVVLAGGKIDQETRDYDGQTGASKSLRSKEMAHDYRYFPDPDLMPVEVDEAWKASIRAALPGAALRQAAPVPRAVLRFPYTITSVLVPDRRALAISSRRRRASAASRRPPATGSRTTCCASSARRRSTLAQSKVQAGRTSPAWSSWSTTASS